MQDQDYLRQTVDNVSKSREALAAIAAASGLKSLPSATNFVAIDCGKSANFAKAILDGLVARGVFVRMPFVAPQNRCIRISAGRPQDLTELAKALPDAIAAARR